MEDKTYNPQEIEKKWQDYWREKELFCAKDFSEKPPVFLLVEFPYPSGAGLHVGHCRSYTAMDVIARKKRMQGKNVMFPMGWDAFGLPTENYALKTGKHPAVATKENVATFKKQENSLGLSLDWAREINTTNPLYYKWTQWIFLKLFEKGLAYKAKISINWCLSCKIGLANEEVAEGKCERCGGEVEKREKEQWLIKITQYAERLINDLELVDFPERVKTQQRDWIGKSNGWQVKFAVKGLDERVEVFTTRIDTIFGCTYLVLSPEHSIITQLGDKIENMKEVQDYIDLAGKKSERERQAEIKDKTGVKLKGVWAINPATGKEIPIFVADYVLSTYGTGAIMAVPAHDERDFDFAKKYNLAIIEVIKGPNNSELPYQGEGVLVNSQAFNDLSSNTAKQEIGQMLGDKGLAEKKVNYKLRDWVFSRQRYWGEPIPLVFCEKCGWVAVEEKDLPVELPEIKDYKPTDEGDSPLAKIEKWVNVKCPKCKGKAKRETDVMPNWAGSNWYFMRYCDPKNSKKFADPDKLKYWMPVSWYNGGMEHTTLHLLYSRFIYKFLWDIGEVPKELGSEPYKKRTSHGMILAEGGVKMSKSKGNVVNPDEVIKEWGADTLRCYEMFMGPFEQAIAWDTKSLAGSKRFLEKVFRQSLKVSQAEPNEALEKLLHKTIQKVETDIEQMKFNTAVSSLMILINEMDKAEEINQDIFEKFLLIFSPFAPHLAEELWGNIGNKKSIFLQDWPASNQALITDEKVAIIIQVNGKARESIVMERDATEDEVNNIALNNEKVKKWISDKEIKKVIFVKNKLINFVI